LLILLLLLRQSAAKNAAHIAGQLAGSGRLTEVGQFALLLLWLAAHAMIFQR
jgi:hypothetical protein